MKLTFSRFFFVLFSLILSVNCFAWNALGHMLVANIAYQNLTPQVRDKVDKMTADLAKEYPEMTEFYQLAPWPDMLRWQKIETYTHWHYIDTAYSIDETPLKNLTDTDNAVWAINQIKPIVENPKANAIERARFLAFLIHIVGDLHQPLHNSGRISSAHPDGDRGGNLYTILDPGKSNKAATTNIHHIWDGGIGSFEGAPNRDNVQTISRNIMAVYPESHFGTLSSDMVTQNWSNEGLELCKNFVYSTPENQIPSATYLTNSKQLAQQRIALAGYRLAHLLNQLLGDNKKQSLAYNARLE